jgi:hypothetical protein
MIYKKLIECRINDEKDEIVTEYIDKSTNEFRDDFERFQLWTQYLKQSDNYKKACSWFKKVRIKHDYPPELNGCKHQLSYIEDYFVFAVSYNKLRSESPLLSLKHNFPLINIARNGQELFKEIFSGTFFGWAIEYGFPKKLSTEMLVYLYLYGNLYDDPEEITSLRVFELIRQHKNMCVYRAGEIIDVIYKHVEDVLLNGESPTIEEFKNHLKHFLESDLTLTVTMINPYDNRDKTLAAISELIETRRARLPRQTIDQGFEFYQSDQFEWPTSNFRMDELNRYLKVFSFNKEGMTNENIAKEIYPRLDYENKNTMRRVFRDRKKAEQIIKNVEAGFFPGPYNA